MLGTDKTVPDPNGYKPRYWRKPMTIALVLLSMFLSIYLFVVYSSNNELREQAAKAEQGSAELRKEVDDLTKKCMTAVNDTLERLGENQQAPPPPTDEPKDRPTPGTSTDTDSDEPVKL